MQLNSNTSTPKTGLAGRMREWMAARQGTKRQRRFTINDLCSALSIPAGWEHDKVARALWDFERRSEISCVRLRPNHQWKAMPPEERYFLYVHDWRKQLKGSLNRKIFKAMYVSHDFAVTDIQRLTAITERDWIDKIVRQLRADGHIQQISRRRCAHGAGAETIYHIVNRDKFKLEVMR